MAKKVKPVAKAPKVPAMSTVFVLCPNVWVRDVKYFQYDVIEIHPEDAELLIKQKQAKATKDDVTHTVNVEGKRVEV